MGKAARNNPVAIAVKAGYVKPKSRKTESDRVLRDQERLKRPLLQVVAERLGWTVRD
jgi:hypothetical protein